MQHHDEAKIMLKLGLNTNQLIHQSTLCTFHKEQR